MKGMRPQRILLALLTMLLGCGLGPALAQAPPSEPVLLTVEGGEAGALRLTAADLAKLPRQTVRTGEGEGAATFEGTPLVEVLRLAGAQLGDRLKHHDPPTGYVVVEATDGYRALFSLAELDPAFTDRVVLLADRQDGQPLAAGKGPLRLVVPGDQRRARWAHQVRSLRIGRL